MVPARTSVVHFAVMSAAETRTGYEHITVARDGATGRLTLNRPTRRNALSLALMQEAIAGLRELSADPDCRVIVLAGQRPGLLGRARPVGDARPRAAPSTTSCSRSARS